jgi:hypothetical protein
MVLYNSLQAISYLAMPIVRGGGIKEEASATPSKGARE